MRLWFLFVLLGVIGNFKLSKAWPGGAPPEACVDFTPQHGIEPLSEGTAEFDLNYATRR